MMTSCLCLSWKRSDLRVFKIIFESKKKIIMITLHIHIILQTNYNDNKHWKYRKGVLFKKNYYLIMNARSINSRKLEIISIF